MGGNPYRDGSYACYVSEPKRDDDPKAIGPLIQACIEYKPCCEKVSFVIIDKNEKKYCYSLSMPTII